MKRFLIFILCFIFSISLHAENISVIRDTEIETLLNGYVKKIFKSCGLNPNNAQVVIVNDETINAFVAGGQTIFVHSGLITHAESADEVVFVLSHETGHIVGGHVIRGLEQIKTAQTTTLISSVLGGLLAVAGGRADAGLAVMMGLNSSAISSFMAYRQSEESAADRTAVDIMEKTGYSLHGFTRTMKELQRQERLSTVYEMPYWQTHPITRERMQNIERFTQKALPPKKDRQFDLARAKLIGFLFPTEQTRHLYKGISTADKYARIIADYKDGKINDSLEQLNKLILSSPQNAYFHELKGQFLFETGQIEQSICAYEKAVHLMPDAPLFHLSLGQVLAENDKKNYWEKAVKHLSRAIELDQYMPSAWRLLASTYGKMDNMPMADYAMSEYYMLIGQTAEARKTAKRAIDKISKKSSAYQHLKDILDILKTPYN